MRDLHDIARNEAIEQYHRACADGEFALAAEIARRHNLGRDKVRQAANAASDRFRDLGLVAEAKAILKAFGLPMPHVADTTPAEFK